MKCYVITETGVHVYSSVAKMKQEVNIEKDEMQKIGGDLVCNMTDHSFEITKDIKLLESVASKKVFSKDKFDATNWMIVIVILLQVVNM